MRMIGKVDKMWLAISLYVIFLVSQQSEALSVGRGIADATGLSAEGPMCCYGNPTHTAHGLHLRQFSRAFAFDDGNKRAVFVVVETTMISQAVHKQVFERLYETLGDLYTEENVMITATHTHSATGGFHTYFLYDAATGGFVNETFDALVNGIALSIERAHNDLRPGTVSTNSGNLLGATINRSPYAYNNDPPEEIIRYQYDVDKMMTLLKLTDTASGSNLGMFCFFAVHTTSMRNNNHLISSDSKGYAAQMMEKYLNPGTLPGQGSILAAFAQTTHGDSSPNINGARCDETYEFCPEDTSACPQWPSDPRKCNGYGPVGEQFADTAYIGDKEFQKARSLYEGVLVDIGQTVDYRFQWVNMSDVDVLDPQNNPIKTCRPSMGYSFGAGTTDGPGIEPFIQAMLEPLDNITDLIEFFHNTSDELIACQAPKPILLPTGELENKPWPWQPEIVPLQIFQIGNIILVGLPVEVATMPGRRISSAVKQVLTDNGYPANTRVLIVSLTNDYSSYLTTFEEYQMQRYEGASTIFGPNTLQAYTLKFQELALALATGATVVRGPTPPDLRDYPGQRLGVIRIDETPEGKTHGDTLVDVASQAAWRQTVSATFVAGSPRNRHTNETILEVQQKVDVDQWTVVATDANWETKFWFDSTCDDAERNDSSCTPTAQSSNATIDWTIPNYQTVGTYRLVHYGAARVSADVVVNYTGVSSEFQVVTTAVEREDAAEKYSRQYNSDDNDYDDHWLLSTFTSLDVELE